MKILFVVPRSYNPKQMYLEYPLGVGILATLLRNKGHQTMIFDGNAEEPHGENLLDWIDSFNPDIIGYSIITPNYPTAKVQMLELKKKYSQKLFIAGGLHANLFPDDLIHDGFDLVCLGEGENRILDILDIYSTGQTFANLDGVVYKNDSGEVVKNSLGIEKVNIHNLPIIDRSVFNLKRYTHHSIIASRGCPYKCKFCCNYTGTILQSGLSINDYEKVIDELEYLEKIYFAKEVFFADDIFLVKKKEILKFCTEYNKRGLKLKWIGQMRADTIDDEVASAMAAAGCKRIYFGVESGSDNILNKTNKKITREKLLAGITSAKKAGIRVKTGWIYGLPGSLDEQYEAIDFMLEMMPHEISVHQLIPFPGTPYYTNPERYGISIKNKKDFKSFCYGGISDNIMFDYITEAELIKLYQVTEERLKSAGYVSADKATKNNEYIYTTPLSKKSMTVFRES